MSAQISHLGHDFRSECGKDDCLLQSWVLEQADTAHDAAMAGSRTGC